MKNLYSNLNIAKTFFILLPFFYFFFLWDIQLLKFGFFFIIIPIFFIIKEFNFDFFKAKILKKKFKENLIIINFFFFFIIHYIVNREVILFYDIKKIFLLIITCIYIKYYLKIILFKLKDIIIFFIYIFILDTILSTFFLNYGEGFDNLLFKLKNYNCSYLGNFFIAKIIFKENSHASIVLVGALFYLSSFVDNIKNFFLIIIISIFIYFIANSTTYLVSTIISSFFLLICTFFSNFKYKNFFKYFLIFQLILSLLVLSNDKSCTDRFSDFVKLLSYKASKSSKFINNTNLNNANLNNANLNNLNLTSNVYFYHSQMIITSLKKKPFGYGFEGYAAALNKNRHLLTAVDKSVYNLNTKDASSSFIKIIVEFGLFSLLGFYFFFKFIISRDFTYDSKIFFIPILFGHMLRGVGYFNGGLFIIVIIMVLTATTNIKNDNIRY